MPRHDLFRAFVLAGEREFGPCGSARESVADAPEDPLQFVDFCLQGVDARSLSL